MKPVPNPDDGVRRVITDEMWRRLATRYEKLGSVFLAVVHVGCILSIIA